MRTRDLIGWLFVVRLRGTDVRTQHRGIAVFDRRAVAATVRARGMIRPGWRFAYKEINRDVWVFALWPLSALLYLWHYHLSQWREWFFRLGFLEVVDEGGWYRDGTWHLNPWRVRRRRALRLAYMMGLKTGKRMGWQEADAECKARERDAEQRGFIRGRNAVIAWIDAKLEEHRR